QQIGFSFKNPGIFKKGFLKEAATTKAAKSTAGAAAETQTEANVPLKLNNLPGDISLNVLAYLPIKDAITFTQSDRHTSNQRDPYIQTCIKDSGLTDVTATDQDKLNFINQFESPENAKEQLLYMQDIGFSKEQTLKMERDEIERILVDHKFTAAVLECARTIPDLGTDLESLNEQIEVKLKHEKLWDDNKEQKLKNICKAITRIKKAKSDQKTRLYLSELDLTSGDLAALMPEIKEIDRLTELNLGANKLTTLPDSIGNLATLTKLHLYNNHLTTLPDSIRYLTNLEVLDLGNNQVTDLPDSIRKLTTLTALSLYNNKLTFLPDSMRYLTNLEDLYLKYNQFTQEQKDAIMAMVPAMCNVSC
ncbi:leucine-rich repeat domain-containing protein, partial [bacterium]|nr:leucine-rich repeat domain-containing protein [bacterium]